MAAPERRRQAGTGSQRPEAGRLRWILIYGSVAVASLAVLAACWSWLATLSTAWRGLLLFLALWVAVAHAALALAYGLRWPGIFGKNPQGGLGLLSRLLLGPYIYPNWLLFHVKRWWHRRAAPWQQVSPGIYLGRRPLVGELPPEVKLVVDLTAELPANRRAIAGRRYRCLPILNRLAPEPEELRRLVEELGPEIMGIYLHCGAGKGRSATVAAALLMARGLARSVDEAERQLRAARPVVSLHPEQQAVVEAVFPSRTN